MKVVPRRYKLHFSDLLYYNIYGYKPHKYMLQLMRYYHQLLMSPNEIYPTFWINILQDLHDNLYISFNFLKGAREAASHISIDTWCQSWLSEYGIASSPHFNEREFSVWKMWKFWKLYIFSFSLKMSFIMSGNVHSGTYKLRSSEHLCIVGEVLLGVLPLIITFRKIR